MKRLAGALLLVLGAWAQTAWGEDPRLDLHLARKPAVVHPVPAPKVAEEDAEQAIAEIKAREQHGELIRELTQSRPRRPDLDPDVISGIQSRNLSDALRRR